MSRLAFQFLVLLIALLLANSAAASESPALNEVQYKASHNAFARYESIWDQVVNWDLRSLEFDIDGGPTFYRVHHVFQSSSCEALVDCLGIVASFSDFNREHAPIIINLNSRADNTGLDDAIASVIERERVFGPGDFLARCPGAASVQDAALSCRFPTMDELRGKILLLLDADGDGILTYYNAYPDEASRYMFAMPGIDHAEQIYGHPDTAFFNTSASNLGAIAGVHAAGMFIRAYGADDEGSWDELLAVFPNLIATNRINAQRDPWSSTSVAGRPFLCQECDDSELIRNIGIEVRSADIWDERDNFYFVYRDESDASTMCGLPTVPSSHTEDWGKVCFMARATADDAAPYFAICRAADDNWSFVQWRDHYGGDTHSYDFAEDLSSSKNLWAPWWSLGEESHYPYLSLDVDARGQCVGAVASEDGHSWERVMTHCFEMSLPLRGIAASSHGAYSTRYVINNFAHLPGRIDKSASTYGVGTIPISPAECLETAAFGEPREPFAWQSLIGDAPEGRIFSGTFDLSRDDTFDRARFIKPSSSQYLGSLVPGDVDTFVFFARDGIERILTWGATDTTCRLFDRSEAQIAYDDDGGVDRNCALDAEMLVPGELYYLQVAHFDASGSGQYALTLDLDL